MSAIIGVEQGEPRRSLAPIEPSLDTSGAQQNDRVTETTGRGSVAPEVAASSPPVPRGDAGPPDSVDPTTDEAERRRSELAAELLPPMFTVRRASQDSDELRDAVLIPDAEHGFKVIDAHTLTVKHRGQSFVVRLDRPSNRWFGRRTTSAILIVAFIVVLLAAFYFLMGR